MCKKLEEIIFVVLTNWLLCQNVHAIFCCSLSHYLDIIVLIFLEFLFLTAGKWMT